MDGNGNLHVDPLKKQTTARKVATHSGTVSQPVPRCTGLGSWWLIEGNGWWVASTSSRLSSSCSWLADGPEVCRCRTFMGFPAGFQDHFAAPKPCLAHLGSRIAFDNVPESMNPTAKGFFLAVSGGSMAGFMLGMGALKVQVVQL